MSPSSNASLPKFREPEEQEFYEDTRNENTSITGQSEVDIIIQSFLESTLSKIEIQTKNFAPTTDTPPAGKEILLVKSHLRLKLSKICDNSHQQENTKPLEMLATQIEALVLLEKHILHWARALRNATLSASDIKMLLRNNLEKIVPAEITPNTGVQEKLNTYIQQLLIKIIMNDETEE